MLRPWNQLTPKKQASLRPPVFRDRKGGSCRDKVSTVLLTSRGFGLVDFAGPNAAPEGAGVASKPGQGPVLEAAKEIAERPVHGPNGVQTVGEGQDGDRA
jgi:hypothetical protein